MAHIEKERIVTSFKVSLNPSEYRMITESLHSHIERLKNELDEQMIDDLLADEMYESEKIKEIKRLRDELEQAYDGECTV